MNPAPCATCPWRKSSTVGGFDIPGFHVEMMRNLACTVGDGDAFRQVMACHYSGEEMFACRGYVAQEGYTNLTVRVEGAMGRLPIHEIMDACEGLELWPDFHTMLAAYEEAQP